MDDRLPGEDRGFPHEGFKWIIAGKDLGFHF